MVKYIKEVTSADVQDDLLIKEIESLEIKLGVLERSTPLLKDHGGQKKIHLHSRTVSIPLPEHCRALIAGLTGITGTLYDHRIVREGSDLYKLDDQLALVNVKVNGAYSEQGKTYRLEVIIDKPIAGPVHESLVGMGYSLEQKGHIASALGLSRPGEIGMGLNTTPLKT